VSTLVLERVSAAPPAGSRPYEPKGAALDLFYAREPEVLIEGPADTGKSRACLAKLDLCAVRYPRMRGGIFRKTRVSLTQTAMVTYEEKVLPAPSGVRFEHEAQQYVYPNGSVLIVAGLDDPEKIKSLELDVAYVQEATELELADWEMLRSRLRHDVMPYRQLIGDCNPGDPGHWLNRRCDAGATRRLKSRHEDNPSITPERIAALDALTGHRYQRLRLGLWVAAEGQFFPEWNPEVHLCDPFPIPAHWTRWTATDYGYAAPFVNLAFARDPQSRRVYVFREIHAAGLRDQQQADLIAGRIREERAALGLAPGARLYALHVGDPSMFARRSEQDKPSIASVYRARGFPLEPGTNNRRHGWQTVRDALAADQGPPRLQVFRGRCPNLERTLPAMVRDPLDPEDLADKVGHTKTEDDDVDALRYGLVAEASPPRPAPVPVTFGVR
jgi:Phage terminase large subunit